MIKIGMPAAAIAAAMAFAMTPSAEAQELAVPPSGIATPAAAPAVASASAAERLKKLDIMLMVSSLRCRHGAHNFRSAYQDFNAKHRLKLNAAHRELKASFVAELGAVHGKKAMDRVDVSMANQYGQGHPWMKCHELAEMTEKLAGLEAKSELLTAADQLLGSPPVTDPGTVLVASY